MLKKFFGGRSAKQDLDGEVSAPTLEAESGVEASAQTTVTPDRPWLAIAFSLEDLDSVVRVRAFGESLIDRAARPETIFGEMGGCDDGLVTVLVHKKMPTDSIPAMENEARRVLDLLLAEVEPVLAGDDYIAMACEVSDGAILQLVATAAGDEPIVREIRVRDGKVERAELGASG